LAPIRRRPATGEARHAPAFAPCACREVEREEEKIFVRKRQESIPRASENQYPDASPKNIFLIVSGGAAGFAAAERLRHEGCVG
jgi:hypothetical protein